MKRPRFHWQSFFRDGSRAARHWPYAVGYDVTCSCGWQSRTGGATRASVLRSIDDHLLDEHNLISVGGKVLKALDSPSDTL
jgi:predicted small metal-binding protein